jgi:hypothetical protein
VTFTSGTADVGQNPVRLCPAGNAGVRVRNAGDAVVFLGGPDVGNDGDAQGYPLDPGTSETFFGGRPKESPVVPAPPDDMAAEILYARTAEGTGTARVSWIGIGG